MRTYVKSEAAGEFEPRKLWAFERVLFFHR